MFVEKNISTGYVILVQIKVRDLIVPKTKMSHSKFCSFTSILISADSFEILKQVPVIVSHHFCDEISLTVS